MFNIEKNVPPPTNNGFDTKAFLSVLRMLEVGDSFLAPKKAKSYLGSYSGYAGIKVKSKKENQDQIRIWRVD